MVRTAARERNHWVVFAACDKALLNTDARAMTVVVKFFLDYQLYLPKP